MKGTSVKKVLILVTILAVPGFLYYLLQDQGKNRYKPLPFFGKKSLSGTFHSVRGNMVADTIYHQVADFSLINQDGESLSWNNYKDKIVVANVYYSRNNVEDLSTGNKAMQVFNSNYATNPAIRFMTISIDPNHDTREVIARDAARMEAKAGKWDFLTGDSTKLYNLVTEGLIIDARPEVIRNELQFAYGNMLVLLDSKRRIRGYYHPSSREAMGKLDDEIKVLLAEELRNTKDGR